MNFFDANNIKAVTGGRWIVRPDGPTLQTPLAGVGIDTRDDLAGKAFVAIRGEKYDGHDFLDEAVKKGAPLLIVDTATAAGRRRGAGFHLAQPEVQGACILEVENTRIALAQLATAYRRTLTTTTVIAITGSSGKTTTKRLIDAVLSTQLTGTSAPKSFNNEIGVPLTILAARPDDQYLVVEVGTNAPGEISRLSTVVEPDMAVITSIGRAHLAGLGSIAGVAREKASLLSNVRGGGYAIVTADSPELRGYTPLAPGITLFGEADDAQLRLTNRGRSKHDWWFEINGRERFAIALAGKHNALNTIAAVAVARHMGLADDAIREGLLRVKPEAMRMCLERIGEIEVCNDAYNANPESMAAALETFIEIAQDASRRIVILGDMLELGPDAPQLHSQLGRKLIEVDHQARIDHAALIGELSAHTARVLATAWPPDRITAITELCPATMPRVLGQLQPGDAVLIKGSRGMALERIINALEKSKSRKVKTSKDDNPFSGAAHIQRT